MNQNNINEKFIEELLGKVDQDRSKYFNEVKNSSSYDKSKQDLIYQLENIQRSLMKYRQLLIKEKEKN